MYLSCLPLFISDDEVMLTALTSGVIADMAWPCICKILVGSGK